MPQFEKRRCTSQNRLTKTNLLAILRDTESTQEDFFNSMELDEWEITSFNPITRFVCIKIIDTDIIVNLTIPDLIGNFDSGF